MGCGASVAEFFETPEQKRIAAAIAEGKTVWTRHSRRVYKLSADGAILISHRESTYGAQAALGGAPMAMRDGMRYYAEFELLRAPYDTIKTAYIGVSGLNLDVQEEFAFKHFWSVDTQHGWGHGPDRTNDSDWCAAFEGFDGFRAGDVIGLLLDGREPGLHPSDTGGSLTVYKRGGVVKRGYREEWDNTLEGMTKVGVVARGLTGELCWAAAIYRRDWKLALTAKEPPVDRAEVVAAAAAAQEAEKQKRERAAQLQREKERAAQQKRERAAHLQREKERVAQLQREQERAAQLKQEQELAAAEKNRILRLKEAEQQKKEAEVAAAERASAGIDGWLAKIELNQYVAAIKERGYDSLSTLKNADKEDIEELIQDPDINMKKPHQKTMLKEWENLKQSKDSPTDNAIWIEDIGRMTNDEMRANFEALEQQIPGGEKIVIHFTERRWAILIIAQGSLGLKASVAGQVTLATFHFSFIERSSINFIITVPLV
eukprot:COSAG01_NODE_2936_length_6828_cov_20.818992_8_plen_488_part_00